MRPASGLYNPAFRLEGVNKFFKVGGETVKAVEDATFDIPKGFITGITGENGSGKTTLLHLMGGLYRPDGGCLQYNDHEGIYPLPYNLCPLPYNDKKQMERFQRYQIAWIFQDLNLISHLTAGQNIFLPLFLRGESYRRKDYDSLFEELNLRNPTRNINLLNNRPSQLSGGEQQRVAIARALVAKPQVILADEPTGNLDSYNRDIFMKLLRSVNRDYEITVVLVTHENPLVEKYCDAFICCQKTRWGNQCTPLQWLEEEENESLA